MLAALQTDTAPSSNDRSARLRPLAVRVVRETRMPVSPRSPGVKAASPEKLFDHLPRYGCLMSVSAKLNATASRERGKPLKGVNSAVAKNFGTRSVHLRHDAVYVHRIPLLDRSCH